MENPYNLSQQQQQQQRSDQTNERIEKMNWIENKYGISIFTAKCVHNILSHVPGHLEVSFVVCILSSDWTA